MRWPWIVVVTALVGGATACQAVFGIEDYAGSGGAGSSSSGGAGGDGAGGAAQGAGGTGASGAHGGTGGDPGCCVPATPPDGWTGYFTAKSTAAGKELASCADSTLPTVLHDGLPGPVTCSACACGAVGGAACAAPNIQCWPANNTTCSGAGVDVTAAFTGGCKFISTEYDSCKLTGTTLVTSTGSCGASGGQVLDKPGWNNATTLCPPIAGADSCPDGQACLEPVASDGDRVCIRSPGQVACPPGWGVATTVYDGGSDARGCAACACTPPSPAQIACTGGGYALFDGANAGEAILACGANVGAISVASTACVPVSKAWYSTSAAANANASGAACSPTGGAPTGAFDPGQPVTLCCR